MDPTETLNSFLTELRTSYPETAFQDVNVEINIRELEAMYPHALRILQKDPEFFSLDTLTMFGVNLSELDADEPIWKGIHMCLFSSVFHGDMKDKMDLILNTAKSLWSSSGQTNDEVDRILNDENTKDHMQEVFDYVTNLRSAKVFLEILEEIDFTTIGIPLDNPADMMAMARNPEHPAVKKAIARVQAVLKHKMDRGEITQTQLMNDIEGIKLKVRGMFGDAFNEALGLGGRREGVPAAVLSGRKSHGSEAARMRLQARWKRRNEKRE